MGSKAEIVGFRGGAGGGEVGDVELEEEECGRRVVCGYGGGGEVALEVVPGVGRGGGLDVGEGDGGGAGCREGEGGGAADLERRGGLVGGCGWVMRVWVLVSASEDVHRLDLRRR